MQVKIRLHIYLFLFTIIEAITGTFTLLKNFLTLSYIFDKFDAKINLTQIKSWRFAMKTFPKKFVRRIAILISALIILFAVSLLNAQINTNEVRLFQSYFYDTPISERPYVQGGLDYSSYGNHFDFTFLNIGAQGGFALNEKIEIQAGWGYESLSIEEGEGQSGITDLALFGRYNLSNSGPTSFAAGGLITLPIGSEDIGAGNLNFGGYGAVRHALDNGLVLCGTAGLLFYETTEIEYDPVTYEPKEETKYETSFNIGAGAIYPVNDQVSVIGEFTMQTEGDYMMLSGGVDYKLGNGRIRGALGIGLDDGAPDFKIGGGYAFTL